MTVHAWAVFALFWMVFVASPGPNAVNCINNGMTYGFRRSMWAVLAILTQATAFLILSALGVTALIAASPSLFFWIKIAGALFLIFLGVRGWIRAGVVVANPVTGGRSIYMRALAIATINAKSVLGYLAAFTQFIQPDVPIWGQMSLIMPTALCITGLSYTGYTALGAWLGGLAMGAIMNKGFRRGMAVVFIAYGVVLAMSVASMTGATG